MSIKKFLTKIVALSLVIGIMLTTTASAFDISSMLNGLSAENIMKKFNIQTEIDTEDINMEELMEKFAFLEDYNYNLEDLNVDLSSMQQTGTVDMSTIKDLIGKLPDGFGKNILGIFSNGSGSSSNILSKLLKVVKLLLKLEGTGTSTSELPTPEDITITATTAANFTDEEVELHGVIYTNDESNDWVLIIHPFAFTGESIAKKIGPYYYEMGYNILAIDLRGMGDSEGSMAMGFLDSLDAYDWLVELRARYQPDNLFIHGISLGGGTTNFVSGIDQFMEQAPADIRIDKDFEPLANFNVRGLVVDSGFVDMTAIGASKSLLLKMNVGLNEDNIEYYSQATNSLKYCKLPVLFIHGQNDSTVDFEQVEIAQATIATPKEDIRTYLPSASHAFIVMGTNADEYKANVQDFVTDYQK